MRKKILSFLIITALLVNIIVSIPLTVSAAVVTTAPIITVSDSTVYLINDIVFNADTATNRIAISGHINLGSGFRIDVQVIDPDQGLVYIGSTTSGDKGVFNFNINSILNVKEGAYKLQFGGKKLPQSSSILPSKVDTLVGQKPVMPATITAEFDILPSRELNIVWEDINPTLYASAGSFLVQGTDSASGLKVNMPVNVKQLTGSIEGYVKLEGKSTARNSGIKVTVEGTSSETTTDANGHFKLDSIPGQVTLIFSKTNYLQRKIGNITITAGMNNILSTSNNNILLWAGDLDANEENSGIGPSDLNMLISSYGKISGTGFNSNADFDEKNGVGPYDLNLLISHYGKTSANYPTFHK